MRRIFHRLAFWKTTDDTFAPTRRRRRRAKESRARLRMIAASRRYNRHQRRVQNRKARR